MFQLNQPEAQIRKQAAMLRAGGDALSLVRRSFYQAEAVQPFSSGCFMFEGDLSNIWVVEDEERLLLVPVEYE
jgi:hypothetical protein